MPAALGKPPSEIPLPYEEESLNPLPHRESSPTGSGLSAVGSQVRENQTQRRGQGKPSPEVAHLQSVCHELDCKTPVPSDVQNLLDDYSVKDIEAAFREYAENQTDLDYVEKAFYADSGGAGVILARRRKGA
jgi:hypothetical protein